MQVKNCKFICDKQRERDRQTDRQRERDRQTDRQTERERIAFICKQRERESERESVCVLLNQIKSCFILWNHAFEGTDFFGIQSLEEHFITIQSFL